MSGDHVSLRSFGMGLSIIFPAISIVPFSHSRDNLNNLFIALGCLGVFVAIIIIFSIFEIRGRMREARKVTEKVEPDDKSGPKALWMWLFLASEVVFFCMLIGTSFALRLTVDESLGFTNFSSGWLGHDSHVNLVIDGWVDSHGKGPTEVLNLLLTTVNTFFLICSSFTMVLAVSAAKEGNNKKARNFLLYTAGIGMVFLGIQVYEYIQLLDEGFNVSSGLFGATFYLQTTFHGLHVLVGIVFVLLIAFKAHLGAFTKEDNSDVEIIGLYWHFVDLVWVILFTVVYLI